MRLPQKSTIYLFEINTSHTDKKVSRGLLFKIFSKKCSYPRTNKALDAYHIAEIRKQAIIPVLKNALTLSLGWLES